MEMKDKVISGLECCATNRLRREDCEAMGCVYLDLEGHGCIHQLIRDALALLKAQEARVMTLVEAHGTDICWYEQAGEDSVIPATPIAYYLSVWGNQTEIEMMGREDSTIRYDNEYGETWRCWTSKPTDEQREATKWK